VAGGFNGFEPVAYLDVYDPATNTWITRAPVPTAGGMSGATLGGQFYVVVQGFSGTTPANVAYAYNPGTNQWKPKGGSRFLRRGDSGDPGRAFPPLHGRRRPERVVHAVGDAVSSALSANPERCRNPTDG
jgi:hypothetical protein